MDIYSIEFIKELLDMTDEEALAFYQGPIYMSLSPAEKENFDNLVFKEWSNQVTAELVAGLHNLPETKTTWGDPDKYLVAS